MSLNEELNLLHEYMVEVELPPSIDDNFVRLIPAHREMVNDLMVKGVIRTYTLAGDRSKLWINMIGGDKQSIMNVLKGMPLYEYFNITIHSLTFNLSSKTMMPLISLN